MTTYAFTGSRGPLTLEQSGYVRKVVNSLPLTQTDKVRQGGAKGVDFCVAKYVPSAMQTVYAPCSAPWSEYHPVGAILRRHTPEGGFATHAEDYLDRNREMVDGADVLIAFPKTAEEETRSGTWATIRYARKVGVEVHLYPLEDALNPCTCGGRHSNNWYCPTYGVCVFCGDDGH